MLKLGDRFVQQVVFKNYVDFASSILRVGLYIAFVFNLQVLLDFPIRKYVNYS